MDLKALLLNKLANLLSREFIVHMFGAFVAWKMFELMPKTTQNYVALCAFVFGFGASYLTGRNKQRSIQNSNNE